MTQNWRRVKLCEVSEVFNGGTPKTSIAEFWDGQNPWVTPAEMGNLETPYLGNTRRTLTDEGLKSSNTKLMPKNSVIMSSRAPIGHLVINTVPMAFNQGCKGIVPGKDLDYKFLYYFLFSEKKLLNSLGSGTTFLELSSGKLKEVEIPLPPLDEQKRIVTKLADAFDALEQLKIAQIQKGIEARSLFDLEFERLMRRNEDNWPSMSIGESCEYLNGKAHEPFVTDDGEYRLVTSKFVSTNGITARSVSKCLSPLNEGDVTFVLSDLPNGKALAKAYLVGKDEKLALNQRVMRIRSTKFVPEFLYLQINRHPELLSYDNGESQTHLKLKQILDCQLFCPEIELQKKVAKRLLSLKDLVNTYDQKVAIKLTEIESLKKRILHLAFSGDF